ncbi:MAG TPA: hypothetical protein DDW52_24150 [Planctomycetaceae bacterium]|nr:hypothetical protein [Planctomycetaceae bacterium]
MVDLDLRKLSAPIEALRPEIKQAYANLDRKWEAIADCLKPVPVAVSYAYFQDEGDFDCLVWQKWNGKKRICIQVNVFKQQSAYGGGDYETTTTPYEEWSAEQRAYMLRHVPGLFEAAEKQTREFIEQTKN